MTVVTRQFLGKQPESEAAFAALSGESQAALRQFSSERLLGYGLAYADVIELRAAVIEGANWQDAATSLAETALASAHQASIPTRIAYLRRASALLRMSQVMMLSDTDERRAIFAQAAGHYGEAASLAGDRQPVVIETKSGPLAGWLHPAIGTAHGSAIVIGGIEGWAMDFASQGEALAARGVDALMLDAPGQGESRFQHHHYLSTAWPDAFRGVIDYLAQRAPDHGIAFIGNSMGGSFALATAAADPRIRACVDNGGAASPLEARDKPSFFKKMMAACGTDDEEEAAAIWGSVDPITPHHGAGYPLLIVQGGADPLVTTPAAAALMAALPTQDAEMVVFSDGDHCIYNHRDDRDALIADWVRERLTR